MSSIVLHTNKLFRDDLFQVDTSVTSADNAHDTANRLLGWYRQKGEMRMEGIADQKVLCLGDGWMIIRSFWRDVECSYELHERYCPVYNPPTYEDHLKDHA